MRMDRLRGTITGLRSDSRFSRVIIVGLIALSMVQAIHQMRKEQAVVLVPPGLTATATITSNHASSEYLDAWALALATLMGNVTPDNVDFIKASIGDLLDPGIYNEVMRDMSRQAEALKLDRVAQSFEPRVVAKESSRRFVTGTVIAKGAGGAEDRKERTFEYDLAIEGYRLRIRNIAAYQGQARTTEVEMQMQRKEEQQAAREEARRRTQEGPR